ncbi:MAG TPA: SDR family oxidoreductase [Candidatus Andersenbacteria bacterium]|nr:MAG: UDP-glucose 4-epimerase [Parcubacteria group bacterium RIFCSPHIGHO2_01_FULL_56_18]HLD25615.1 SDR family oxidoreductase [Candidatus Andersenbacteria bacterium]
MMKRMHVLVTGGAGYKGAVLVPKLLAAGHQVTVLDWYLYGDVVLAPHAGLKQLKGDIRDMQRVRESLTDVDTVIHLACISNDPSVELDPALSKSINLDAFWPLVQLSKAVGVTRFIFAASSSVYGVSDALEVTEEHPHVPITDYNRYKSMCEDILWEEQADNFTVVSIRPATVCGYSPRLRLDLTVNILTNHAVNKQLITVFGGEQKRPNIHIEDITDLYVDLLQVPAEKIAGQAFNVGYENHRVKDLAQIVKAKVEELMPELGEIGVTTTASDDIRSYHISSEKIKRVLGFVPRRGIEDAVADLVAAFQAGNIPNSLTDPKYFNIKMMQTQPARVVYGK